MHTFGLSDDELDDADGGETSDSSEAEINEIRTQMAVQTLLTRESMITPGGPDGDDDPNDDNIDMYAATIAIENLENENENNNNKQENININNNNNDVNNLQLGQKKENFSSMLTDKLVGIDMLENDIVNEMEQDVQDPNGMNSQTPGNTAGGPNDEFEEGEN